MAPVDIERMRQALEWLDKGMKERESISDDLSNEVRRLNIQVTSLLTKSGLDDTQIIELKGHLVHRMREIERLRAALTGMMEKWAPHSGLCCTFVNNELVILPESCVCGAPEQAAREALEIMGEG